MKRIVGKYLLKKFPEKGGWTYVDMPEFNPNKSNPFGWVKVKGSIDHFKLEQFKLLPKGNGTLFLPVRLEIRKKIKKEAGQYVDIVLEEDLSKYIIPKEILESFEFEPKSTLQNFYKLSEGQQKTYVDWILSAKSEETKAKRTIEVIEKMRS